MPSDVLKRFLLSLASWGTGLLLLLLIQGRGSPFSVGARLPHLAYLVVILASFPAGIAAARSVFGRRIDFAGLATAVVLSVGLVVVVFTLSGWVAPARLMDGGPRAMNTPALAQALTAAVHEAERTGDTAAWVHANTLIFEHDRRYAQSLLALLLPVLGLLVGSVGARIPLSGLRMAFYWAVGAFLLVSEYFAFENGFELVAVRTVGGETPAGLFALIVPGTLILAFGAAVLVDIAWPAAGGHDARS